MESTRTPIRASRATFGSRPSASNRSTTQLAAPSHEMTMARFAGAAPALPSSATHSATRLSHRTGSLRRGFMVYPLCSLAQLDSNDPAEVADQFRQQARIPLRLEAAADLVTQRPQMLPERRKCADLRGGHSSQIQRRFPGLRVGALEVVDEVRGEDLAQLLISLPES